MNKEDHIVSNTSKPLRIITITILLMVIVFIAGCQSPKGQLTQDLSLKRYAFGKSVEQRRIDYSVIGSGSDTVLVIASIHGDEAAGTPIVHKLTGHLAMNPDLLNGRRVVILPVANPDGVAHNQRYNANGVDLNRNFTAENRENNNVNGMEALSEPESQVIERLIRLYRPSRIVTYHQPLDCIDYDGPAKGLAYAMGRYTDLPVKKLGARPGSLGAYAGETLQIPIVTVELREEDSLLDSEMLWEKYHRSLLAAIIYPDMPEFDTPAK